MHRSKLLPTCGLYRLSRGRVFRLSGPTTGFRTSPMPRSLLRSPTARAESSRYYLDKWPLARAQFTIRPFRFTIKHIVTAKLRIIEPGGAQREFPLEPGKNYTIGRSNENSIV